MKNNNDQPVPLQRFTENDVSVLSKESVFNGFFTVNEYTLKHRLFSGNESEAFTREIFERGDAVVVMPYDIKRDKILFNEQFRLGALRGKETPWLLEFVAGMFAENESPKEVAIREAKEEAGISLSAEHLKLIMKYFSSPGGTSECIHLYLALFDSSTVESGSCFGLPEENEDIKLHLIDRTKALELLEHGKISNAATIIGLQWLAMNYKNLSV